MSWSAIVGAGNCPFHHVPCRGLASHPHDDDGGGDDVHQAHEGRPPADPNLEVHEAVVAAAGWEIQMAKVVSERDRQPARRSTLGAKAA